VGTVAGADRFVKEVDPDGGMRVLPGRVCAAAPWRDGAENMGRIVSGKQ
jgi:hypothetical protein